MLNELRLHRQLAGRRAPDKQLNAKAKFAVWLSVGIGILYLMFIAVAFSSLANDADITTLEFIFALAPLILGADFLLRLSFQQTPARLVKPYLLLPIPKYRCIEAFLLTALTSPFNFLWLALLVPYALMSILFVHGIGLTILFLLAWIILIAINSQWYLICRTLANGRIIWWLLPFVTALPAAMPLLIHGINLRGWEHFFNFYAMLGTHFEQHPLPFLAGLTFLLAAILLVNRQIQYTHIRAEVTCERVTSLHKVSRFALFNRYGTVGEYLKLEVKTILRNKAPRKSFLSAVLLTLTFSLLTAFTNIYDGQGYANFWGFYNFAITGLVLIVKIMGYEGNYIDALLTRKEHIFALLKAKYIFYCVLLLLPFILMLPAVFMGKWRLLMLISYGVFTAGFLYFCLFQLTVYNKETLPLNTQITGKSRLNSNYVQLGASMGSIIVPATGISLLQWLFGETTAYLIFLVIGVLFILTHHLWLRHIYRRFMARRYANLEGFRATR